MKLGLLMLALAATAVAPASLGAAPNSPPNSPKAAPPTQSQGATQGAGWDHMNGPDWTGQPGAECGEEDALFTPGHADQARGSAFNEDGKSGTRYAGTQPQNSRNTASVSQYDTACLHQPDQDD